MQPLGEARYSQKKKFKTSSNFSLLSYLVKRYFVLRENIRVSDENSFFLGVSARNAGSVWLRLCFGAGFAVCVYGLIIGGHASHGMDNLTRKVDAYIRDAGFAIDNITVVGQKHVTNQEIARALSPIHISLVRFDIQEARRRIEDLPWVSSAKVKRLFPSTVKITLNERKPFALWQSRGQFFLVDAKGVIVSEKTISRWRHLPHIVGDNAHKKAKSLIQALQRYNGLANQLQAAKLIAKRRWDLVLDNGVKILLPEKEISQALTELMNLEQQYQILSGNINNIDMRLSDRITLRKSDYRNL